MKEKDHKFMPDGLSEEVVAKYRKEFWDDAHNKSCIQKMFVFLGVGEKGGTGADIIAKGWTDNGWSIPVIEEKFKPDRVETCLRLERETTVSNESATETTETTTESATETTETTTETTTESTTESILMMIRNNPKITAKEIAAACGITVDGVAYHIKKLKLSGRISRVGGARYGGEWKVN